MTFDRVYKRTDLYDEGKVAYLVGYKEKGLFRDKNVIWFKGNTDRIYSTTNPRNAAVFTLEDAFREIGRYKIQEVEPYG